MPKRLAKDLWKRPAQLVAMEVVPGEQRTGRGLEPGDHSGDKEISHESGPGGPPNISLRHENDLPPPQTSRTQASQHRTQGHQAWPLLSRHQIRHRLKPQGSTPLLPSPESPGHPSVLPLLPLRGPNNRQGPAVWIPQASLQPLPNLKLKALWSWAQI